jgi:hypothetical protein
MSKLNAIILDMAAQAKTGAAKKRTLPNGAEIGFLVHKGRPRFFVRRPTDNQPLGAAPPEAFTREAVVFWRQAEQGGGLKVKQPEYGRTKTHLFALFEVVRWPGDAPAQEAIGGVGGQ